MTGNGGSGGMIGSTAAGGQGGAGDPGGSGGVAGSVTSQGGGPSGTGGSGGGTAGSGGASGVGDGSVSTRDGSATDGDGSVLPPGPVDDSPSAWHCVNWAVNGDNFQPGTLLLSGIFETDNSYDAVRARAQAVEDGYGDLLKANSFRMPINEPTVNTPSYWANYKAIIDVGVAKRMKVLVAFWARDTGIGRPADINAWYAMWQTVIDSYVSSPYVFFDIHNEPHGYTNPQWIQQVKDWMARFPNVPKSRIVVAGTGWDDNVANVATAFPDMPLLEVHDYVFNGNFTGSARWSSQLLGRLGSGTSRTIVGEFGAGVSGVDFATDVENNAAKSFMVGFTNAIHDNKMGSCWWPGLWAVPGNTSSWGLLRMNGSGNNITYTVNNQSALDRIWHSWGLN